MKSFTALDKREVSRIRDALDGGMSPEDIQAEYALMAKDECKEYLDYKAKLRKINITLCNLLVDLKEFDNPKDKLAFIETLSTNEDIQLEINFAVKRLDRSYDVIYELYDKQLEK